jgi:hypothetical protein
LIDAYVLYTGSKRPEYLGRCPAHAWPYYIRVPLPVMMMDPLFEDPSGGGNGARDWVQPTIDLARREVWWRPPKPSVIVHNRVFVYVEMAEELEELLALVNMAFHCLERVLSCPSW